MSGLSSAPAILGNVHQHRNVAYVLGCDEFEDLPNLKNARSGAQRISDVLSQLGYAVSSHENLGHNALLRSLAELRLQAAFADKVVFYLASHGFQHGQDTFVAATDSRVNGQEPVGSGFVPLRIFDTAVSDRLRTRIYFVDACREISGYRRFLSSQCSNYGEPPTAGQFICFASQFGAPAYDGSGGISPFASSMLYNIARESREIERLSRDIRLGVIRSTGGLQVPWSLSSLLHSVAIR